MQEVYYIAVIENKKGVYMAFIWLRKICSVYQQIFPQINEINNLRIKNHRQLNKISARICNSTGAGTIGQCDCNITNYSMQAM
jgi:hypothetical protein